MISNFLPSVVTPLGRRASMTLLAMVLAVALALPSFAEVGGNEPEEGVAVSTTTTTLAPTTTTEAPESDEAEDDGGEEGDESDEETETDGVGSERSAEVHALLDAGCNPGRGIGLKSGHEKNGNFECELEGATHPVHADADGVDEVEGDEDGKSDHPGQGQGRDKDKKDKGGS